MYAGWVRVWNNGNGCEAGNGRSIKNDDLRNRLAAKVQVAVIVSREAIYPPIGCVD
jgi:hypothetical protein